MKLRTSAEVRKEFEESGTSITQWAVENGHSPNLVFEVLAGRKRCLRGQSHDIAVKLGMKAGKIRTGPAKTALSRSPAVTA